MATSPFEEVDVSPLVLERIVVNEELSFAVVKHGRRITTTRDHVAWLVAVHLLVCMYGGLGCQLQHEGAWRQADDMRSTHR